MSHFVSILPKAHDFKTAVPPEPASVASRAVDTTLDLQQIPAEEVQIHSGSRIVFYEDPQGLAADRFRFLRLRLRERAEARKLKIILVTSPLPQDGKSTVAVNLATALAERGKRKVLLVEADLYHATIAPNLEIPSRPGLAECLEADLDPVSALRRLEPLGWYFLAGGDPHGNPTELLQSDRLSYIFGAVSPHFDWIVIDSPPVIPVTDALSLARHADATLMVVRAGQTPQESVKAACTLLGPQTVIGIILNGVEGLNRLYSKYYGRYGNPAKPNANG